MLDSLKINYQHRKYLIENSSWGQMDNVDQMVRNTLNIKELHHKCRKLNILDRAYSRARAEAMGRCFKALQPLNF
jgi:DNA polymerase III delta prime subunit